MRTPDRPVRLAALAFATLVIGAGVPARSQTQISELPSEVRSPEDNPATPDKIELGRLLFWDPILSGRKDVACATCHHPDFAYSDGRDISIGTHGVGLGFERRFDTPEPLPFARRNSPSLLNTAFNGITLDWTYEPSAAPMFWDKRAASLEAQALEPIKTVDEMRGDTFAEAEAVDMVVARLQAIPEYRTRFARAFGTASAVTAPNLGKAIAAFERTLLAADSPFDRYMRGDASAMTMLQLTGMQRFQTIGCANCHSGPMFSDYETHTLGVPDNARLAEPDSGVNGRFAFRTPSLRNAIYTAPYMHNGALDTLEDVLSFYNGVRGSRLGTRNPAVAPRDLDPLLFQLNVAGGRGDLIAFLQALGDDRFDRTIPDRVPSGLAVGGHIRE